MSNTRLSEEFLDNAATEAIGAHGVEESDAHTLELAKADEAHRQAARDLRDTVARMAGAAPYLEPSVKLREAILQATAPKTFNISDYRRTNETNPKWLRRALVASIAFLIFAGWYNTTARTTIDNQVAQIDGMKNTMTKAEAQYNQMRDETIATEKALSATQKAMSATQFALAKATVANPNAPRKLIKDSNGRDLALIKDPGSGLVMVLVPDQAIAPGKFAILSGKGVDGQMHQIQVLAIGKPDDGSGLDTGSTGATQHMDLKWGGMMNDTAPRNAGMMDDSMKIFGW